MSDREINSNREELAKDLIEIVKGKLAGKSTAEFSSDPEYAEHDIIEFNSRLRVFGLEKFNGPCYVGSVCLFRSEDQKKKQDAAGSIIIFAEEQSAGKLFKTMGLNDFDEDDDESLVKACGDFTTMIATDVVKQLQRRGYPEFIMSEPESSKNDLPQGVAFPFSQNKFVETEFHIWKEKVLIIDSVVTPS